MKHHRERGPKRFFYTYADLALLYGVKEVTVRQWVSRGLLDPTSIESVCCLSRVRYTQREIRAQDAESRALVE